MSFDTLNDWLRWQEHLHPRAIDLGLDRVRAVLDAMQLTRPSFRVITVGGTNGKGSCVVFIEAMLRAAGFSVGAYLSPHLLRYNERIRLRGVEASDVELCNAFEVVDRARGDVTLTYFEFGTLAALELFQRGNIDVAVLEVGMGGRLDAVNALEPSVAIVTSVGLDHREWLGNDREAIGAEKAPIYRHRAPAICGDRDPPCTLLEYAGAVGADLQRIGQDFDWHKQGERWCWQGRGGRLEDLPYPYLAGEVQLNNAASVIAALRAVDTQRRITPAAIRSGLASARLPGRLQRASYHGRNCLLDVGHNPEAAQALAAYLRARQPVGRVVAVFGILRDKAAKEIGRILDPLVSDWYLASLSSPRGLDAVELEAKFIAAGISGAIKTAAGVLDAFEQALAVTNADDIILVCGSFHTVGPLLEHQAATGESSLSK